MTEAHAVRDDWDAHWSDYADAASDNPAQRYRRRVVRRLLGLRGGERILDIGSGQGDLAAELAHDYPSVELCGVDVSQAGVEIAQAKVPAASFFRRDLLRDPEPPAARAGWASHAICSEVLEHVDEPERLLRNAAAWLAPGCRIVVTVPGGPMSAFDRSIGHRRHFSAGDLAALLETAGYDVEWASGVGFPFFNLYRLAILQRGDRLVQDLGAGSGRPSPAARGAMRLFDLLLRLPMLDGSRGWQMAAVAHTPA